MNAVLVTQLMTRGIQFMVILWLKDLGQMISDITPEESRTLTPVNQTQPNHSPATASKNWANFLAVLLGGFLSTFMHHQLSLHLASQKILNLILRESKTIFPS